MVFSSEIFLFIFLPVVLIAYHLFDRRYKNVFLLLASLFFYAWGEPTYVLLMIVSIAVNYMIGLLLEKAGPYKSKRRIALLLGCIWNIGMLGIFKYTGFFVDNLNRIGFTISDPEIVLPIGISFYTFQIMSYIIDVYRREVPVQHNILNLGLYVSMFPQLIAGPIVRYIDVEKEIMRRAVTWEDAYSGAKRFMFGFAKKILIADQVSSIANLAFSRTSPSMNLAWLGIIAYTIQIYFDFSGYSDMAIGLGKLFGFHFNENFNYPYISKSIREFWRRWHISLSGWFRDYVYIPLGGSRVSTPRIYFNLLIVFFLTGFWHGASWNFIIWGLWYGLFLILERVTGKKFEKIPTVIRHIYSILVIVLGWVFFRADGLKNALLYIKSMFSFQFDNSIIISVTFESLCFLILGIILSVPLYQFLEQKTQNSKLSICTDVISIVCFLLGIMYMVGVGFSPFLYFRF